MRSLFIAFIVQSLFSSAQTTDKNLYSGGMLIFQPGYSKFYNEFKNIESPTFGIGGIFRFYIGDIFVIGLYGGTQKGSYSMPESEDSYFSLSYGNLLAGITRKYKKSRVTASISAGHGSIKNLHINEIVDNRIVDARFISQSALLFSPLISFDYALTNRLLFTAQVSYFVDTKKKYQNTSLQLGLLFNR